MKNRTYRTYGTSRQRGAASLVLYVPFVLLVPSLAAAGTEPDLAKGLVAHYTFDKDASDASGNGHHATARGVTPVPEGKLGGAFAFNGTSDFVAVPAKATQGLTWFTVALWFKTKQSAASPRTRFWSNPTLVGVSTGGWGSRDVGLMLENGRAAYFHGLHADGSDMSWYSAVAAADDKWHHVALVCQGQRMMLYLDGQVLRGECLLHAAGATESLGNQAQTAAGNALGAAPVFIGACNDGGPSYFFRGLIDDVRLWSRALTADEVSALQGQK